jgi:hypothetical protein
MISLSDNVRIAPHAMFRDFDGESVILNLADESYYGLDEFGTRMWEVLTTSDSLNNACDQLLEEFDVDRAVLQTDVVALVSELLEKKILVRSIDSTPAV